MLQLTAHTRQTAHVKTPPRLPCPSCARSFQKWLAPDNEGVHMAEYIGVSVGPMGPVPITGLGKVSIVVDYYFGVSGFVCGRGQARYEMRQNRSAGHVMETFGQACAPETWPKMVYSAILHRRRHSCRFGCQFFYLTRCSCRFHFLPLRFPRYSCRFHRHFCHFTCLCCRFQCAFCPFYCPSARPSLVFAAYSHSSPTP